MYTIVLLGMVVGMGVHTNMAATVYTFGTSEPQVKRMIDLLVDDIGLDTSVAIHNVIAGRSKQLKGKGAKKLKAVIKRNKKKSKTKAICFWSISNTGRSIFHSHRELLKPLSKLFDKVVICIHFCDPAWYMWHNEPQNEHVLVWKNFTEYVTQEAVRKKCSIHLWQFDASPAQVRFLRSYVMYYITPK